MRAGPVVFAILAILAIFVLSGPFGHHSSPSRRIGRDVDGRSGRPVSFLKVRSGLAWPGPSRGQQEKRKRKKGNSVCVRDWLQWSPQGEAENGR